MKTKFNWLKLAVVFLLVNEAANYWASAWMDRYSMTPGAWWAGATGCLYIVVAGLVVTGWRGGD